MNSLNINDLNLYDALSPSQAVSNLQQENSNQSQYPNSSAKFWSNSSNASSGYNNNSFLNNSNYISGPTGNNSYIGADSGMVSKPVPKQLNINAPSYVPTFAKDVPSYEDKLSAKSEDYEEQYQVLKVEMIMKNQIIKNLTEQLTLVDKARSKQLGELTYPPITSLNQSVSVPQNHYQLFQDLSKTLQEKTVELDETKDRLEALLVSLAMGSSGTAFTKRGHYDEQDLTQKIVSKLNLLKSENENLLKMISYGNKSSLIVELGMLRSENIALKKKLSKFEK